MRSSFIDWPTVRRAKCFRFYPSKCLLLVFMKDGTKRFYPSYTDNVRILRTCKVHMDTFR